jgi:5-methylcytosine-specific restriction endonuclease McrA
MKKCSKCKQQKPLTDFSPRKKSKDGKECLCKNCHNEISRKSYAKNIEKERGRAKKRYADHPESILNWKKKNPDKVKKAVRKWQSKHPEIVKKANRKFHNSHKKERYQFTKRWRKDHPMKVKAANHKRRKSLEAAGGLLDTTIKLIYEDNIKRYGTLTCYLCLKPIPLGKDHLEHKTPLSRGGTNEYHNLGVACQHCNCSKHNKTEKEFMNL